MDIKTIRLKRLRALIATKFDGNKGKFADAIGRPRPNVYRLLSDTAEDQRAIGEDLARSIEQILGLEPLWLDREGDPDPNTVSGLLARLAPILDTAPKELRDAVLTLALKYQKDPADGARIVAAIRALVPDDPAA